jgi:hypothetical protein
MRWIAIGVMCSVLAGCQAYSDTQESIGRSINPDIRKYEAQQKPQRQQGASQQQESARGKSR